MSNHTPTQRFGIGTQFMSRGKHPKICTVVDVLRTYDSQDRLVRIRYVATHQAANGQIVTDHDVCDTSIAMRLVKHD